MITQFQNYNYIKSWTTWVQQPWNTYSKRLGKNWLYALMAPLMVPALGLALAGRVSCQLLALCKPEVRRTAANVIKRALQDTRLNPRKIPEGVIRHGNGEYLVFKRDQNGIQALTEQEYASIHHPLQSCHLWTSALYNHSPVDREHILNDPYAYLQAKIKQVDPAFEVAFVPTVVYEMFYVESALKEELAWMDRAKTDHMCYLPPTYNIAPTDKKDFDESVKAGLAFHAPCYGPDGKITASHLKESLRHSGLQNLHYRINAGLIDFIKTQFDPGTLSFTQLQQLSNRQIANFKTYAQGANTPVSQKIAKLQVDRNWIYTLFHLPHMLAFTNPKVEAIVNKALKLECSTLAHTHAFFYRGSIRKMDRLMGVTGGGGPMTLSLGATLFAGIMRDTGACALEYSASREALVYPVRKAILFTPKSPIAHLPSSTILQLNGIREHFHARFNLDQSTEKTVKTSFAIFRTLRRQVIFLDTPARPQQT